MSNQHAHNLRTQPSAARIENSARASTERAKPLPKVDDATAEAFVARRARAAANMTGAELAAVMDVSNALIGQWEDPHSDRKPNALHIRRAPKAFQEVYAQHFAELCGSQVVPDPQNGRVCHLSIVADVGTATTELASAVIVDLVDGSLDHGPQHEKRGNRVVACVQELIASMRRKR